MTSTGPSICLPSYGMIAEMLNVHSCDLDIMEAVVAQGLARNLDLFSSRMKFTLASRPFGCKTATMY
jgi:hypothetical protein